MRLIPILLVAFYLFITFSSGHAEEICSLSEYLPEGTDFKVELSDPGTIKNFFVNLREDIIINNLPLRYVDISTEKIKEDYVWKTENTIKKALDGEIEFSQKGELPLLKGQQGELVQQEGLAGKSYVLEYSKGNKIDVNIPVDQPILLNLFAGLQLQIDENEKKRLLEETGAQGTEDTYLAATLPKGTSLTIPLNYGQKLSIKTKKGAWLRQVSEKSDETWLEVEGAARAAMGHHITMSVRHLGSPVDLGKKEKLEVCFRGQGGEDMGKPYLRSPKVEILEEQGQNSSRLRVEIPDFSDRRPEVPLWDWNSFLSFKASPVQIKVVEYDNQGKIALEATGNYAISQVGWAFVLAVLAFVVGYIFPGLMFRKQWKWKWDPIWLARGVTGKASLSKFQIWLWTLLIFSSMVYVFVINGQLMQITEGILILMGITGGSSLGAKFTAVVRQDHGLTLLTSEMEQPPTKPEPAWKDLISTGGEFDIFKFQMLLFTGLVALYVISSALTNLQFPEVPDSLMWLMGISNGVYLGGKVTGTSAFGELVTLHAEIEEVERQLQKLNNDRDKLTSEKTLKAEEAEELKKATEEKKDDTTIQKLRDRLAEIDKSIKSIGENIQNLEKKKEELKKQYEKAIENAKKLVNDKSTT